MFGGVARDAYGMMAHYSWQPETVLSLTPAQYLQAWAAYKLEKSERLRIQAIAARAAGGNKKQWEKFIKALD